MAGFGWRLTRGRGAKQFTLIACAVSAVAIALLGKADGPIFDKARAELSDWTGPVLSDVRGPLIGFERWFGNLGTIFTVYSDNAELRRENAELHKWQEVALSLESRLHRYEHLLNVVPDPKLPFITARVIGEASRPFVKTMILNAGTAQQVKKGQAVVDDRGLLGRIYVTGEDTSWVILLTDLNSRVPVVIESSHRRAILVGDNTPAPQLELDVGDGPIKPGDRVLSTGDGGLLPPDVPVGVVMGEGDTVRVALFAAPGTSDFVHIVDYHMAEPPPATDSVPGVGSPKTAANSQAASNIPAKITSVLAVKPPPPPAAVKPPPLLSQDPNQPQFDGQTEEQDR